MIHADGVAAYNFTEGSLSQLTRHIAARTPGLGLAEAPGG
jgi:acyl CoA:acetate/3-ketoacid CoA transferase